MNELMRLFDDLVTEIMPQTRESLVRTQTPEKIHLEIELPGVKKEEIKISIEDSYLSIAVNSKKRTGSRTVYLGKYHDVDRAGVTYENGLLVIDVPIKENEKKTHRVLEIK